MKLSKKLEQNTPKECRLNWVGSIKVREIVCEKKITVPVGLSNLSKILWKFFAEVKTEKGQALAPTAFVFIK